MKKIMLALLFAGSSLFGDNIPETNSSTDKIAKDLKQNLTTENITVVSSTAVTEAEQYLERGYLFLTFGRFQEAESDFSKAIKLNPNSGLAYLYHGISLSSLRLHQTAIKDFTQAIKILPMHANAYYNRGLAYSNLEDYPSAISDYTEAIKLKPKDAQKVYSARKYAYLKLKNNSQALSVNKLTSQKNLNDASIKQSKSEDNQAEKVTKKESISDDKLFDLMVYESCVKNAKYYARVAGANLALSIKECKKDYLESRAGK